MTGLTVRLRTGNGCRRKDRSSSCRVIPQNSINCSIRRRPIFFACSLTVARSFGMNIKGWMAEHGCRRVHRALPNLERSVNVVGPDFIAAPATLRRGRSIAALAWERSLGRCIRTMHLHHLGAGSCLALERRVRHPEIESPLSDRYQARRPPPHRSRPVVETGGGVAALARCHRLGSPRSASPHLISAPTGNFDGFAGVRVHLPRLIALRVDDGNSK